MNDNGKIKPLSEDQAAIDLWISEGNPNVSEPLAEHDAATSTKGDESGPIR